VRDFSMTNARVGQQGNTTNDPADLKRATDIPNQ
jgi:hypothetical protein